MIFQNFPLVSPCLKQQAIFPSFLDFPRLTRTLFQFPSSPTPDSGQSMIKYFFIKLANSCPHLHNIFVITQQSILPDTGTYKYNNRAYEN